MQAGSAIREERQTLVEYRRAFEHRRVTLLAEAPAGTRREDQSVHTTWDISFERLRARAPAAAELLSLCALLGPDGVPLAVFEAMSAVEEAAAAAGCPELLALHQQAGDDEDAVWTVSPT